MRYVSNCWTTCEKQPESLFKRPIYDQFYFSNIHFECLFTIMTKFRAKKAAQALQNHVFPSAFHPLLPCLLHLYTSVLVGMPVMQKCISKSWRSQFSFKIEPIQKNKSNLSFRCSQCERNLSLLLIYFMIIIQPQCFILITSHENIVIFDSVDSSVIGITVRLLIHLAWLLVLR